MSLGQLALHIASVPLTVSGLLREDAFDAKRANFTPPQAETRAQILDTFEKSIRTAVELLQGWDSNEASAQWKLMNADKVVLTLPRIHVVRTVMLNHWYHHRGQLTVYLRLLDLSLPVTYGRSGDVNPFV
jgi:uncharacterized damage-inducible protein DinB